MEELPEKPKPKQFFLNWRPFHSFEECKELVGQLRSESDLASTIFMALPYQWMVQLPGEENPHCLLGLAAMESAHEKSFTENIAARLIKEAKGKFVLLGTSHAREVLKEKNEEIQAKIRKALQEGLIPILCIGETYEELMAEKSAEVLTRQIGECLNHLSDEEVGHIQFVYEASWVNQDPYHPSFETIQHAYQFAVELIQSLVGSRLAKQVALGCPVPSDLQNAQEFVQAVQAPGYYFSNPSLFCRDRKNKALAFR